MKKVISTLLISLAFFCNSFNSNAQVLDGVRTGFKVGVTSSSSSIKNAKTNTISLYQLGVLAEFPLGRGFALQPGLQYQMKGVRLDKAKDNTIEGLLKSFESRVGYLEIPIQLQWGADLLAFRPYVFAEPFIGFRVNRSSKMSMVEGSMDSGEVSDEVVRVGLKQRLSNDMKKMEYGFSLGAGVEFWRLQFSATYFWNLGNLYDDGGDQALKKIKKAINAGKSFNGVSFSVAVLF